MRKSKNVTFYCQQKATKETVNLKKRKTSKLHFTCSETVISETHCFYLFFAFSKIAICQSHFFYLYCVCDVGNAMQGLK